MMAQDNTKLCDFSNTNNNDFISTPIALITDAESCEINATLLNLVMKDPFSGLPSEDVATHLNSFVALFARSRAAVLSFPIAAGRARTGRWR